MDIMPTSPGAAVGVEPTNSMGKGTGGLANSLGTDNEHECAPD